ncbi:MAG TPA: hypothetical protein VGG45_18125 [Terracidiphilus sp.]|jgi:hypothetical protein
MVTRPSRRTSFTRLNTAIEAIDAQGADATPNTNYTINITGPISITGGGIEAINLLSGSAWAMATFAPPLASGPPAIASQGRPGSSDHRRAKSVVMMRTLSTRPRGSGRSA